MRKVEEFEETQKLINEFEGFASRVTEIEKQIAKNNESLKSRKLDLNKQRPKMKDIKEDKDIRIEKLKEQMEENSEDNEYGIDRKLLEEEFEKRMEEIRNELREKYNNIGGQIKEEETKTQEENKNLEKEKEALLEKRKLFRTDGHLKTITMEIMEMEKEIQNGKIELAKTEIELREFWQLSEEERAQNPLKWNEIYKEQDSIKANIKGLEEKISKYREFLSNLKEIKLTPEEVKKMFEIEKSSQNRNIKEQENAEQGVVKAESQEQKVTEPESQEQKVTESESNKQEVKDEKSQEEEMAKIERKESVESKGTRQVVEAINFEMPKEPSSEERKGNGAETIDSTKINIFVKRDMVSIKLADRQEVEISASEIKPIMNLSRKDFYEKVKQLSGRENIDSKTLNSIDPTIIAAINAMITKFSHKNVNQKYGNETKEMLNNILNRYIKEYENEKRDDGIEINYDLKELSKSAGFIRRIIKGYKNCFNLSDKKLIAGKAMAAKEKGLIEERNINGSFKPHFIDKLWARIGKNEGESELLLDMPKDSKDRESFAKEVKNEDAAKAVIEVGRNANKGEEAVEKNPTEKEDNEFEKR